MQESLIAPVLFCLTNTARTDTEKAQVKSVLTLPTVVLLGYLWIFTVSAN